MKVRKIVGAIIVIILVLINCMVYVNAASNGTGGGNSGVNKNVGGKVKGSSSCGNVGWSGQNQGYRVYMVNVTGPKATVATPVYDFVKSGTKFPSDTQAFFNTRVGNGAGSSKNIREMPKGLDKYLPVRVSGSQLTGQGEKLREWFDSAVKIGSDQTNLESFIRTYFGNDIFENQYIKREYKLVIEPVFWYVPITTSWLSWDRTIYGSITDIAKYSNQYASKLGDSAGGYTKKLTNQAGAWALVLKYSDPYIGLKAPDLSMLNSSVALSNRTIYNNGIGYGLQVYAYPEQPPITIEKSGGGPGGPDDTQPQPDYASTKSSVAVWYNKASDYNLKLDSTQWSLHARATKGNDGWQGKNQVLPGGAIYSLTTENTTVTLDTWEPSTSSANHTSFASQARDVLDSWEIIQYVDDNAKAKSAFNGIQVKSGGVSLSSIGNKNKTQSDAKYYLREGSSSNKANEADLDITSERTTINNYTVRAFAGGRVEVYKQINNGEMTQIGLNSTDSNALETKTGVISAARQQASSLNPLDSTAYIEMYAVNGNTVYGVGFSEPEMRTSALDPVLCPAKTGTRDLFTKANISQFRLQNKSSGFSGKPVGYIGTFDGNDYSLKDVTSMIMSKPFYIPNANVQDLGRS